MTDLGSVKVSATLIIISADGRALIIQRPDTDTWGGKWTVAGGKLGEEGVKTHDLLYFPVKYCLIREAMEEVGIKVKFDDIHYLCSVYIPQSNRLILSFFTVLESFAVDVSLKINRKEVQDWIWIKTSDLKYFDFIPDIDKEIEEVFKRLDSNKLSW